MFAVIRIRSGIKKMKKVENTLKLLRLKKVNSCVILPESSNVKGMLQKSKDLITWGEINKEIIIKMLEKRLRSKEGQKKITKENLNKFCNFDSFDSFADAIIQNKIKLNKEPKLNPVFRLTPPSKGFKGNIKETYPKGALGHRGKEINNLIKKMI